MQSRFIISFTRYFYIKDFVIYLSQAVKNKQKGVSVAEALSNGFRLGMVMFVLHTSNGVFQTFYHVGNFTHKLLGGSRPRPQGVLDAIGNGIEGFFMDTFVVPWVALYTVPVTSISR